MIGRIDIIAPTGQTLLSPVVHDDSQYSRTLMGEHSVRLRFDWDELITLPIGTYIEYLSERYTLPYGYAPRQGAGLYEYSVAFLAEEMTLRDRLFFYLSQGYRESQWTLTGTLEQFATELRLNLQANNPRADLVIAMEQVESNLHKTLEVDAMPLFDALSKVSDLFGAEWWRSGNTYYIGRMPQGDEPLSVRLTEVAESFVPQGEPLPLIARLYAFGGSKNLPRGYRAIEGALGGESLSRIGAVRLRLPQGTEYIEGAEGGREHVERFEDIYPKYTATITSVSHRMAGDMPIYKISDSAFRVEPQHILQGQTLSAVFETGNLSGMEFELALVTDGYEIKPNDKYGQTLPNSVIFPEVGNKFSPFGIDIYQVREDLVGVAENQLLQRATEWLERNNRDERDVELRTNPVYCYEERIELTLGQSLRLIGATPTGDKQGRITAISYPLSNPHEMRCTVGNSRPIGFGERLADQADRAKTEAKAYTDYAQERTLQAVRRQWNEVEDLGKSLERSLSNRFSGKIDPLLVRTMQLLAGDESLQFAFVERPNADAPKLSPNIHYDRASNTLRLEAGAIRHYTLGITELKPQEGRIYRHWAMPQYRSHRIEYPEREYFLYAVVPQAEGEGVYHLLDSPVSIDHTEGYYHLLVGVLGVEREGDRVFTPLYGFTEVLPGRITTGRITSADGRTYFDLDEGEIGGNIKFRGFDNQSRTEVSGGLLLTEALLLRDKDGKVRAMLNGRERIRGTYAPKGIVFAAGITDFATADERRNVEIWHSGLARFGDIVIDPSGAIRYHTDGDQKKKPYMVLGGRAEEELKHIQTDDISLSLVEEYHWEGNLNGMTALSTPKSLVYRSQEFRLTESNPTIRVSALARLISNYPNAGGALSLNPIRMYRARDRREIAMTAVSGLTLWEGKTRASDYQSASGRYVQTNQMQISLRVSDSFGLTADDRCYIEIGIDYTPRTDSTASMSLSLSSIDIGQITLGKQGNMYIGEYGIMALYHKHHWLAIQRDGYILSARGRVNLPGVILSGYVATDRVIRTEGKNRHYALRQLYNPLGLNVVCYDFGSDGYFCITHNAGFEGLLPQITVVGGGDYASMLTTAVVKHISEISFQIWIANNDRGMQRQDFIFTLIGTNY